MRALRLFLFFTAVVALLLGVADSISLLLGGATRDYLIASGFTLLALGLGAVFRGAGHVPLRASFLLLGLGGALPLLAGFAPVGAAFAVFLFLPIRALGAQLTAAIESHKAGASLFACAAAFGLVLFSNAGLGLPGFIAIWAVAGVLQRLTIPPAPPTPKGEKEAKTELEPRPPLRHLLPNLLAGSGLTFLVLFLLPYRDVFDSGAVDQDLRRWLTISVCLLAGWFTFGAALATADGQVRKIAAAVGTLGLALALRPVTSFVAKLSTPEVFAYWMSNQRLRDWSGSDAPILAEENPFYVPWLTILSFGALTFAVGIALRVLLRTERTSASSIAPVIAGAGATLLLCGVSSSTSLLPHVGTLAVMFLVGASIATWSVEQTNVQRRWIGIGIVAIAAAIGLRAVERPTIGFPLRDNFIWKQQVAGANSDMPLGSSLSAVGWVSTPRRFTRTASAELNQADMSFVFDGRTKLGPEPLRTPAQISEALLAASLTPDPQRILMVGSPEPATVGALQQLLHPQFTFACDPPQIVPLALDGLEIASESTIQRSLATTDGPFDVVLLRGSGIWEGRRSSLRVENIRQAALRLEEGGVCVFACAPEQLVPGMLVQWIVEFQRVFDKVSVFVLPDGMSNARILIAGSDGTSLVEGNWPTASSALAVGLDQFGLPVNTVEDLRALEVQLQDELSSGSYWMFRGPMRGAEAKLAPTAFKLIAELKNVERATSVLSELAAVELADSFSLVDFFVAQLGAQEYSVHDTYLDRNPLAIETSSAALDELLATTRAFPTSDSLKSVWHTLGVVLVEQRELGWMDNYFTILHEELGWSEPEILLVLAHASLESLDFDSAKLLVDQILSSAPNFNAAIELKRLVEAEETVPHDAHAGHNH